MNNGFLEQVEALLGTMTKEEITHFAAKMKQKIREAKKANSATATRMAAIDGRLVHKLMREQGEIVLNEQVFCEERAAFLTRNSDRALFGLPLLPDAADTAPKRRGRPKKNAVSRRQGAGEIAESQGEVADLQPEQSRNAPAEETSAPLVPEVETAPGDAPLAISAPPDADEKWKTFPNLPGTPRKHGGTWLGVKKDQKERPKSLGATWDALEKQWYAPEGLELGLFLEWMP